MNKFYRFLFPIFHWGGVVPLSVWGGVRGGVVTLFLSRFGLLIFFLSLPLNSQVTHSSYSDTIGVNDGSITITDSIYNFARNLSFLDYDDCNNCPLRAHVIAFVLSRVFPEINTGKVWLFADSKLSSRHYYYKTHRRDFLNGIGNCPQWGFHVAPFMIFGNDTVVIDPSTQSSPAALSTWAENISANTAAFMIIKDNIYYSYPEDGSNLFDDTLRVWRNKNIFITSVGEINFLAEKLTTAYHKIFDPLKFIFYKNKISALVNKIDK